MTRYAVASNFDHGRLFFTGAIDIGTPRIVPACHFIPQTTADRDDAFQIDEKAAADCMAASLTELCGLLPPKQPRTWFVVELPMERGA
jgi:hypothetical protein